jgi:endoglucanase
MQSRDIIFMADLAKWMAGPSCSPNVFYWCWNANSADTGGIVSDDWKTVRTSSGNPQSSSQSVYNVD